MNAVGGGTVKHWDAEAAKVTWLVSTMGSANQTAPAQSKLYCTAERDKNMLGNSIYSHLKQKQTHL